MSKLIDHGSRFMEGTSASFGFDYPAGFKSICYAQRANKRRLVFWLWNWTGFWSG